MTIVGIRIPNADKRKVSVSLDLEVAHLVRQVARLEKRSVAECVQDMLSHYVENVHPDWELIADAGRGQKRKARK